MPIVLSLKGNQCCYHDYESLAETKTSVIDKNPGVAAFQFDFPGNSSAEAWQHQLQILTSQYAVAVKAGAKFNDDL